MASARRGTQRRSLWSGLAEEFSYRRTLEERARLAHGTIPAGGVAMRAADSWLMERVRDLGSAWYRMRGSAAGARPAYEAPAGIDTAMHRGRQYRSSHGFPARLAAAALTVALSGAALVGCGKQEPAQDERPDAVVVAPVPVPVPVEPAPIEPAPVPEADATLPDAAGEGSAASAQEGAAPGPAAGGVLQRPDPFVPPQTLEERVEPQRQACDPQVPYRERPELAQASLIQPPTITGTRAGADGPSTSRYRAPQGRSAGENELLSYRSERPLTITLPELTAQQRALGLRYVLSGENAELIAREGDTLTMPTGRTALRYISSEGIQVRLVGPDKGCGETYASVRMELSYAHPPLVESATPVARGGTIEAEQDVRMSTERDYPLLAGQGHECARDTYGGARDASPKRARDRALLPPARGSEMAMDAMAQGGAQRSPAAERRFSLFGPSDAPRYAVIGTCVLACAPPVYSPFSLAP